MTNLSPTSRSIAPLVRGTFAEVLRLTRTVAFWTGVALPMVYLPLIGGGLVDMRLRTFVALLAVNYLALVAGANYGRSAARGD